MHAKFGDDQCPQTTLPALGHITDTHLLRKRLRSFCEDVINFWHEVRSTSNNHHVPFRSDMSRSSKTPPISMVDQDLRECSDPSQAAAEAIYSSSANSERLIGTESSDACTADVRMRGVASLSFDVRVAGTRPHSGPPRAGTIFAILA